MPTGILLSCTASPSELSPLYCLRRHECLTRLVSIALALILLALARLPPSGIPPLLLHAHRHPPPGRLTRRAHFANSPRIRVQDDKRPTIYSPPIPIIPLDVALPRACAAVSRLDLLGTTVKDMPVLKMDRLESEEPGCTRPPSPDIPSPPHPEVPISSRLRPRQPSVERTTRTPAAPFPRSPVAPASFLSTLASTAVLCVGIPEDHKPRCRDGQQLRAGWMYRVQGWIDGIRGTRPQQAHFPRHPVAPASLVSVLALLADDEDDDDSHISPHHHRPIPEGTTTRRPRCAADRDAWPTRTPRYVVDPTQTDAGPSGGRAWTREALAEQPSGWSFVIVSVRPSRRLFLGVDSCPTPTRHPTLAGITLLHTRSRPSGYSSSPSARLASFSALRPAPRRQGNPRPLAPSSFSTLSLFPTQPRAPVDQSSPLRRAPHLRSGARFPPVRCPRAAGAAVDAPPDSSAISIHYASGAAGSIGLQMRRSDEAGAEALSHDAIFSLNIKLLGLDGEAESRQRSSTNNLYVE
ncbi:hypothetical protein DFH09DRAFT_1358389 [Mycena vulgaris]|nr:hypothetical protein DFH09DRAFT_1358389 [Mycena vulgaris]